MSHKRILDLGQHPGAYGHGGRDPIGVINILKTADVFMTVSLPGVTTAQCHRSGQSLDVIKVPPLAVHVVQWLADLKVQWRVIDMDGSVFEGLDPIYYFLQHHRLRHRNDNGNFGFGVPNSVTGSAASVFGTANPRMMTSSNGSFVVPMSVNARMDQMGCGSPPPKVPKTVPKPVPPVRQSSPVKMSARATTKRLPTPQPRKATVAGVGSGLTKSFEVNQGQNSQVADTKSSDSAPPIKEFEIIVPQKCACMDSLGYMPFGCFCQKPSQTVSNQNSSGSIPQNQDPRSPTEIIDSLDIHAPDDTELFADESSKASGSKLDPDGSKTPSNTFLHQKTSSNTFLDQKEQGKPLVDIDDIQMQPGDMLIHFPPILPPNPPGRRIPPIFRWEVQIKHRPQDPALPTATERRQIFMDSIRPVKFNASMKGKEYEAVHDFEWKTCLG